MGFESSFVGQNAQGARRLRGQYLWSVIGLVTPTEAVLCLLLSGGAK
jgi:hypothetical protein